MTRLSLSRPSWKSVKRDSTAATAIVARASLSAAAERNSLVSMTRSCLRNPHTAWTPFGKNGLSLNMTQTANGSKLNCTPPRRRCEGRRRKGRDSAPTCTINENNRARGKKKETLVWLPVISMDPIRYGNRGTNTMYYVGSVRAQKESHSMT